MAIEQCHICSNHLVKRNIKQTMFQDCLAMMKHILSFYNVNISQENVIMLRESATRQRCHWSVTTVIVSTPDGSVLLVLYEH